ncbi:MAG: hypothetical protein WBW34_08185 [Nitrososphaeraceae archaeon]|jgi:hypothetical protein
MRLVVIMAAGLGTVSAIMVGLLLLSIIPTENYSLDVDPMKDEQSLFVNARVVLTNTGKMPLTNLRVDYGSTTESVSRLDPGQKVSLSPPSGSNLNTVVVSTSEGINVTKDYRKPIKLPGMIGS